MIQLQRIVLVWVTLMIITNILVEAQVYHSLSLPKYLISNFNPIPVVQPKGIIKQPTAKSPTIPFPSFTTKQPDPSPTTKKPDPPPPVTPPPSLTKQPDPPPPVTPPPTIPPPPPKQQPLPPTTDPLPPPISTKQPDPLPSIPAYTTSNPVSSNPATLPNPISTDSPASTSNIPCTISKVCPDQKMFCNLPLGICQFKGRLDNKCNNDNECQQNLICNRNVCQFRDSETDNQKHYNVKKAAIIGGSVIGFFSISGLIFAAYRHFKTSKSRKVSIPSTIYSTTDDDTIYPFSERSNSFSDSAPPPRVPITRAPTTNRYDPPGRPRQGFYNNYNNNEGGYMRQNEQGVTRTMNLIQQTRGNFIPPTQPNYNWNYGVPPMMNQGLFPIPTVGNYGGPIPNNMKNFGGDNINNLPGEDKLNRNNYPTKILTNKVSLPELNFDDKQKGSQTLGDNQEKESVYDFYARPLRPPRPPKSSE